MPKEMSPGLRAGYFLRAQLVYVVLCSALLLLADVVSAQTKPLRVVLVDKKTNQLHSALYQGPSINITKSYHATLGKVVGDKIMTDDKKTPEGIYFLLYKRTPPELLKKFGVMAFPVDYPNPIDKIQKKTGFGIMLHATDDPSRLNLDYDSDGCVVVDNHELAEISADFTMQLSPMIVYDELKPEYLKEDYKPELKTTVNAWLNAWRSKDIDGYIGAYREDFVFNGMKLKAYKNYKMGLNKKYYKINIQASNFRYFYHPKYDVVMFTQRYRSEDKNGKPYFDSVGTKFLYFIKDNNQHRIAFEDYKRVHE
jgi:murein L,D-transpeptidase YafK